MADVKIPVENATLMVSALKDFGIVNPFMQAAILAILWKESGIQAVRENMNYRDKQGQPGTGIARLRFVFQTAFKNKPDEYVAKFVGQPEKLSNVFIWLVLKRRLKHKAESSYSRSWLSLLVSVVHVLAYCLNTGFFPEYR